MKRLNSVLTTFSRLALAGIFWVVVRVFQLVEIHGLEHVARGREHPTIFAMAHKRDLDPMVEVPSVLAHRGRATLTGNVHFAKRTDAFAPVFLARIVMYPRWFARILRPISAGAVLRLLGIHPIERIFQESLLTKLQNLSSQSACEVKEVHQGDNLFRFAYTFHVSIC